MSSSSNTRQGRPQLIRYGRAEAAARRSVRHYDAATRQARLAMSRAAWSSPAMLASPLLLPRRDQLIGLRKVRNGSLPARFATPDRRAPPCPVVSPRALLMKVAGRPAALSARFTADQGSLQSAVTVRQALLWIAGYRRTGRRRRLLGPPGTPPGLIDPVECHDRVQSAMSPLPSPGQSTGSDGGLFSEILV